jgi:hypothetical protein
MVIIYILLAVFGIILLKSFLICLFLKFHWICSWEIDNPTDGWNTRTCLVCGRKQLEIGEYNAIVSEGRPIPIWKDI